MKKIYFSALIVLLSLVVTNKTMAAGCTGCVIDTTGCFGAFGAVCPDTLPPGNVGVFYDENVTFHIPAHIVIQTFVLPQPITIPIVNITIDTIRFSNPATLAVFNATLDTVAGLRTGLSWDCDNPGSCEYFPNVSDITTQYGCVKVCGFPCDTQGTTNFTLNFTYQIDIRGIDTLEFAPPLDILNGLGIGNLLPDSVSVPFPQAATFIMATGYVPVKITKSPDTDYLCPGGPGSSITLDVTGYVDYVWSTSETGSSIIASAEGEYLLTVTDANSCVQETSTELFTLAADAGADSTICAAQVMQLSGSGGENFLWTPAADLNDDTVNNPVIIGIAASTDFILTVGNGTCTVSDTVSITIDNSECAGPCTGKCNINKAGCTTGLTPSICQTSLPQLVTGADYDENLTFYFPATVNSADLLANFDIPSFVIPIINIDIKDLLGFFPNTPVPVSEIAIDVTGLPQGMNWECDQIGNDCHYFPGLVPGETEYGCITLCGDNICDQAGNYEVTVTATIVFNIPLPDSLPVPIPGGGFNASIPMKVILPLSSPNGLLNITSSGSNVVNPGQSVTFTASSGYASYLWSTGETISSITVSNFGEYSVTAVDNNGCAQEASLSLYNAVGIEQANSLEGTVALYPNPNNGSFEISFDLVKSQKLTIEVFTVQGKKVFSKAVDARDGKNQVGVDLSSRANGVYFVKVTSETGKVNRKVTIY